MLPSGQNPDSSVGPKIDPALPAAEVRLAFPPRDDLEAQGNGRGRTPDEVRLQHEVSILSRRVTDLEKALSAANTRAETELNNRRAEEAYANRTINELRDEVRRQAERARGFQIELSKIEASRIAPLEAEVEGLKAAALIAKQVTTFIEQAEAFADRQSRSLNVKQPKRPKSPTLPERMEWLAAALEIIEGGLTERAEKHRQRGETVEQQRRELGVLRNERTGLQEALARSGNDNAAKDARHAKELSAEVTRRELLESQLRDARAEVVALGASLKELGAKVKGLERFRGLAESLLEQQRAASAQKKAESGVPSATQTGAAPSANPVGMFVGPRDNFLEWLLGAATSPEPVRASFEALIAHPEGIDLVRSTKQWLEEQYEASLTGVDDSNSPQAKLLSRGREAFDSLLAGAIEQRGAFNFLLKLPADETVDYVNRLSERAQTMLMALAAVNPEWSHGLGGRRALALLDTLPSGVRASLAEKVQDTELTLMILFGSDAIRQGIRGVQNSYRVKYGTRTDERSPAAYRAKIAIADEHSGDAEIVAAREALRAYLLLSEQRQNFVWTAYPPHKEGFAKAHAVLGYDVRDAIALIGLQFDATPQTGTPP